MPSVRRTLLLVLLLALYLASDVRSLLGGFVSRGTFDPFLPAARAIEQRIADGRFTEALPLAIDLERAYPGEPQIAWWFARVHHGLQDPVSEAAAWERYVESSPAPGDACPAWPEACTPMPAGSPSRFTRTNAARRSMRPMFSDSLISAMPIR